MENYSYQPSYPDSGDSSPRSREIEFENPSPWEDSQNYKVKFMCSYGGKIQPRPHDNQLSYMGGETKILAVDRSTKFAALIAKLSALCDNESVSFKYQLPGEDLDALISVTNDDDLEHMMNEYDRQFRASPKPARMRLFLFPANPVPSQPATVVGTRSFGSDDATKSEKERFVEALNSVPIQTTPQPSPVVPSPPQVGNADFLFELEKGVAQQLPPTQPVVGVKLRDPIVDQILHEHEMPAPALEDRAAIGSDAIQKHIQDLQRLRIEEQQRMRIEEQQRMRIEEQQRMRIEEQQRLRIEEQQRLRIEEQQEMYRRKSDDNLAGGYPVGAGSEYYVQKVPDKVAPVSVPGTMAIPTSAYWPEKQVAGGVFPASTFGTDQQVYMIPAPANPYHGQMIRPMTGHTGQGYYVQRLPEIYREQQTYNVPPPQMGAPVQSVAAAPPTLPHQAAKISAPYSDSYGMVRPATAGAVGMTETGYSQMAYDGGRQVYYTAQGGLGVVGAPPQPQAQQGQQYQPMGAADVKALNQEAGKVVPKPTQASV